ncbi:MAG: YggT family protein [Candidatus Gracilibacteria bacterium]|nr:YggT family protein [Candidatus Gracilibacteria bacterium]
MTLLLFSLLMFLSLIQWVVFIDVILSWGTLIGINFRPKFIGAITLPLYETVRRLIPSSFGGIDFAPIIVFIAIELITKFILTIDPGIMGLL